MSEFIKQNQLIKDKNVLEFQMLWKKHYGTEINKEQALDKGLRLLRLIEAVARDIADERQEARKSVPTPQKSFKKFNDKKFIN